VHSIPNNNDNQDIVSMGTNSAVLAKKVLENSYQVMSIHIMAICQAIDLLESDEKERLSPKTKAVYKLIRSKANFVKEDVVPFESIAEVCKLIKETPFNI